MGMEVKWTFFTHSDLGPPSYKTSPNGSSDETMVSVVLNDGEQQLYAIPSSPQSH